MKIGEMVDTRTKEILYLKSMFPEGYRIIDEFGGRIYVASNDTSYTDLFYIDMDSEGMTWLYAFDPETDWGASALMQVTNELWY